MFLLLSLVSMFLAWHWSSWRWTFPWLTGQPPLWSDGAVYTLALLGVLGFHEFGHFLQAVRYRMDVSWPYMIPMPPPLNPFGTLGAVIVSVQGYRNRRELFDVGVTGPLAGLIVAVPLFAWGIATAKPVEAAPFFGEMVGMRLLTEWFHGPLPAGWTLALNPAATAGWVGIFLTGLNLIPVGQLDGGHVAYALLGKRAAWLGYAALATWVGMMVGLGSYQLSLMLLLVLTTGVQHPPTLDEDAPLGWGRTIVGWISLLLPILCLTLTPLHLA